MTDNRAIVIFVPGHPVPKGSGEGTAARRQSYRRGVAGAWRERLQLAFGRHAPRELWRGAVRVDAVFTMRRPQRIPAAARVPMLTTPDLDKLLRFVLDEATGHIYGDDAQVVSGFIQKRYAGPDASEGVVLYLSDLRDGGDTLDPEWVRTAPNAIPELSEVTP